jgi:hypothetical protein
MRPVASDPQNADPKGLLILTNDFDFPQWRVVAGSLGEDAEVRQMGERSFLSHL